MNIVFYGRARVDFNSLAHYRRGGQRCPCGSVLLASDGAAAPGTVNCMACGKVLKCGHADTWCTRWPGGLLLVLCRACGLSSVHDAGRATPWSLIEDIEAARKLAAHR